MAKDVPWGILLLFGGGLAIAAGFGSSGLASWIGGQMSVLEGVNFLLVILLATGMVLFLTEITSNTATATMILPVLASLALALAVPARAVNFFCSEADGRSCDCGCYECSSRDAQLQAGCSAQCDFPYASGCPVHGNFCYCDLC